MTDLKKKSIKDLQKLLRERRQTLREFRFGSAGSRTRNVREGRNIRREIARMLTELKNREVSAE
jgi:ribosomal protein L29